MAISSDVIRSAVGLGGANQRADVELVQRLLNAVPPPKGGPSPALAVDGLCGPKTCGAIRSFQIQNKTSVADGRIDPGRQTERILLALLEGMGLLARLLTGKGVPPGPVVPQPPRVKGPLSPVRRRFMAICKNLLPPPGSLTTGKKTGPKGTGCGEFPGRVFVRVPVIPPNQPGAFKVNVPGVGICYLTSPTIAWEKIAKAVDAQYPPAKTWVPFTGRNRPLPGDIYILNQYDEPEKFQHVGVIVSAVGSDWMTADGGQGNGWQSGFVKRRFHSNGQIDGEFGNKAILRGWVDLDALFAVAIASFPKNL